MKNKIYGNVLSMSNDELAKDKVLKNKQSAIGALEACDEFVVFTRVKNHNHTQCVSSIKSKESFNEIHQTIDIFIGVIREQIRKYGDIKDE